MPAVLRICCVHLICSFLNGTSQKTFAFSVFTKAMISLSVIRQHVNRGFPVNGKSELIFILLVGLLTLFIIQFNRYSSTDLIRKRSSLHDKTGSKITE